MPSATLGWNVDEDMGKKKRISRDVMELVPGEGYPSAQREYEPILDMPEIDGELSVEDERSRAHLEAGDATSEAPDLKSDEGLAQALVDHDAMSLYARSHFPVTSTDRDHRRQFDDGATVNSSRSIAPLDVEYVWENGRRYCGSYYMPNDKLEQTRLLLVHEVYKSAFNNEPTSVPLENPTSILDVGTGTGEWAIDMADRFSDCEVTGTDIADIFPKFAAPNLFWEIDDAELEWLRPPNSYDLVHLRNMAGAFSDWSFVYQQAFKVCKPGGWIELLDYDDIWSSGNYLSMVPSESMIHTLARDWKAATIETGYLVGATHLVPQLLRDAGFVDVVLTEKGLPISPKEMSTGLLFLKALIEGLEAHSLRLLTKYKGYTAEQVRTWIAKFSKELKNIALNPEKSQGFVVKIKVLTGRKPSSSGYSESQLPSNSQDMMAVDSHNLGGEALIQDESFKSLVLDHTHDQSMDISETRQLEEKTNSSQHPLEDKANPDIHGDRMIGSEASAGPPLEAEPSQ